MKVLIAVAILTALCAVNGKHYKKVRIEWKEETIENLKYVFKLFDKEQKGYLTISSLNKLAKDIGEDIDHKDIVEMIERADFDSDGKVSFEDFYYVFTRKFYS